MIHMPHRSITRFFVPMIDVLTLLFCIYLLMPMVSESDEMGLPREKTPPPAPKQPKTDAERARELRQSLSVRVLEIDGVDGKLYYRDARGVPFEIRNQRDATNLITEDRRRAGSRQVYYLLLYPRDEKSSFPTVGQERDYNSWFSGVALGRDLPQSDAGKKP